MGYCSDSAYAVFIAYGLWRQAVSDADLFETPAEKPAEKRVDMHTIYMREHNDLPEGWRWTTMEVLDHEGKKPRDWRYVKYTGAVYSTLISRGPRKGRDNLKKPDEGTFRVVVVDDQAFRAWLPTWEQQTGKCHVCQGSGQKWMGWSADNGHRYAKCPRCDSTGHPRLTPAREDRGA